MNNQPAKSDTSGDMAKKLPKFRNPPLNEVYCVAYFQELHQLDGPHLGEFWKSIEGEFPATQTQHPLPPATLLDQPPQIIFGMGMPVFPRTWFLSSDGSALVQIQRDRLIFNWRAGFGSTDYPHYPVVLKRFKSLLIKFRKFIHRLFGFELRLIGTEMGYVNIIPPAPNTTVHRNVQEIFPLLSWGKTPSRASTLSAVNWNMRFGLSETDGNLHVSIQTAQNQNDGSPVIKLDFLVRRMAPDLEEKDIWPWFNLAHETIVISFAEITSEKLQEEWGRWQ